MRAYDIIQDKKVGKKLSEEALSFLINGYMTNQIPDYQMSAFLMAVYFKGMDEEETAWLTKTMVASGGTINLSSITGLTVDKHSTGGVGDKTSLVLLPLMAACDLKVSKLSGRGLGHTGGTIDKLESIPGFQVDIDMNSLLRQVNDIGLAISGQSKNLVPADKLLYALRDVTATVDSLPLIASSIMSKKIASGAEYILLDVKVGSGAFMKDVSHAVELGERMIRIGESFNRKVSVVLTNMSEPLGYAVGNSLEVVESIHTLQGKGPKDLEELCLTLNAAMLQLTGKINDLEDGINESRKLLSSFAPLEKFKAFVEAQKGDLAYVNDPGLFARAKHAYTIKSHRSGYIQSLDAEKIGLCALATGAGRETKTSSIDYRAGIILNKKVGDPVQTGDSLATIFTNKDDLENDLIKSFHDTVTYSDHHVSKNQIIIGLVDNKGFSDMRK